MGKPEPRVKWTKADLVLKPDDRVSIDTKTGHSMVTITKTKRDDSSTYIIEATNSSGRATATVDVNILGKTSHRQEEWKCLILHHWIILNALCSQTNLVLRLPLTSLRSPTSPASWPGTRRVMMGAPESPITLWSAELLTARSGIGCPPPSNRPHTKLWAWSGSKNTSSECSLKISLVSDRQLNIYPSLPDILSVGLDLKMC